jgi:hypothetical protein
MHGLRRGGGYPPAPPGCYALGAGRSRPILMHTMHSRLFASSLLLVGAASAADVYFTSQGALNGYVGSLQTESFNGVALDGAGTAYLGDSFSNGVLNLSLSDPYLWAFSPDTFATSALGSTYLANTGGSLDLVFSFSTPMHAFGGFFGALADFTDVGAQMKVTFAAPGGSQMLSFAAPLAFNSQGSTNYWGVYSDNAFSSLTLHDTSWTVALDDISYSSARHVNGPSQGVPDTGSTLALALGGLGGLLALRRRLVG